jgi:hypothetical protein
MSLSKHQNTSRPHVYRPIVFVCVFVCLAISGVILLNSRKNTTQPPTATLTIPPYRISTGDGSYAITINIPNQMKFVSPKLGISFLYSQIEGVPKILTKEEGDKIYIYAAYNYPGFDYHTSSQYIEVFQKNPNDTLETAIKKIILAGYSERDCFVENYSNQYRTLPPNFTAVTISYPGWNGSDAINPNAAKCPMPYTNTSGIVYFLMDKNHPDKFVFLEIGQVPLPPPAPIGTKTLDETIQFFP